MMTNWIIGAIILISVIIIASIVRTRLMSSKRRAPDNDQDDIYPLW